MSACRRNFDWRIGRSSFFMVKSRLALRMCPHLMRHFPRPLTCFETEKYGGWSWLKESKSTFFRWSVIRKIICLSSLLSSSWMIFVFGHSVTSDLRNSGSLPPGLRIAKFGKRNRTSSDVGRVDNSWHVKPLTRLGESLDFSHPVSDVSFKRLWRSVDPPEADLAVGPKECVFSDCWVSWQLAPWCWSLAGIRSG